MMRSIPLPQTLMSSNPRSARLRRACIGRTKPDWSRFWGTTGLVAWEIVSLKRTKVTTRVTNLISSRMTLCLIRDAAVQIVTNAPRPQTWKSSTLSRISTPRPEELGKCNSPRLRSSTVLDRWTSRKYLRFWRQRNCSRNGFKFLSKQRTTNCSRSVFWPWKLPKRLLWTSRKSSKTTSTRRRTA